jgi:urease accessory protein
MTTSTSTPHLSKSERLEVGVGRIVLVHDGSSVSFAELSSTYPLKLLSPQTARPSVALVYILSYGGGLVGGDRIALSVDVQKDSTLFALTQATTILPLHASHLI